jgi:hypothetical protein
MQKIDDMSGVAKFTAAFIFPAILAVISGCSVVKEGKQAAALARCDFRIESVTALHLMNISVQNIRSLSDLSLIDAQQLIRGVAADKVPLTMYVNVEIRNPNPKEAGMKKLDWILFVDDIEMAGGSVDQDVTIPPDSGVVIVPVKVNADLKQVLQGKSLDAILNFGMNLAGIGNKPTRFTVKLKPTIMIGKKAVVYPGYISVKTEYTSQ